MSRRPEAYAYHADDSDDFSNGREFAKHAATLLQSTGNRAGESRALAEQIYADHLSWESEECLTLLDKLSPTLVTSRFQWIRAQMSLERSNCANQTGDMGTYLSSIDDGVRNAKSHKFPSLYLRGLGFQALADASVGNVAKGFSLATQGLGLFWSSRVDVMKGYNLYSHLDAMANQLGLSYLQLPDCLQGAALLDSSPNLLSRPWCKSGYLKQKMV